MTALAAWSLLKRFWWAIPLVGLLIYGAVEHHSAIQNLASWQTEKDAHALDIATWRAASAKAIADNIADVRAKETDAAVITEKANHDLESQLADARAAAARYAGRMRCQAAANPGSPGEARIGETASPPGEPVGTGGDALVPQRDLEVCAANTVKARGWQDWYASLRERYNADGTR